MMAKKEKTQVKTDKTSLSEEVGSKEGVVRAPRRWNAGNIFWGLFLVLIGTLFLLDNLGVVDINFSNLWTLWPIFIIMAGVSMVAVRGWVGVMVSGLVALLALALVALVALDIVGPGESNSTRTDTASIVREVGLVEKLNLSVEAGAGTIDISSAATTKTVDASLTSTVTTLHNRSDLTGTTQNVFVSMNDNDVKWWNGRMKNDLRLVLGQSLPTDLKIDAGAASITADLSQVDLKKLDIDSGASSIDVKLGRVSKSTEVSYDIGVSSITLRMPRESGVSVTLESGLSGSDLPNLKEVSENYFESENFASATHKITIHGKMGMANLKVLYY